MLQDGNEHGEDMSKSGTENPQRTQKEESVPEEDDCHSDSPCANDISLLSTDLQRRRAGTETTRTGFNVQYKKLNCVNDKLRLKRNLNYLI